MTRLTPQLVSTVIPVYNRPAMLRRAVQSVLDQTYRPIEIIVVDDGSTDETSQVADDLADENPGVVRSCRIENSGPGPAREQGRQLAQGEYIQYLDSDDRLTANKFADQVAALQEHPCCGIAYGLTRLVNQEGIVLADPFKWTDREISYLFPGLLVDRWWCTHTPLYRRELTDRIGPWCNMRWSQDWEYDSRAGALKTKLVHCGTHVSEHVHHDGQRQTSDAAWTTDPVRLRNRLRLLQALWKGAAAAEVKEDAHERQHFARWCFAIARQCSAQGMKEESLKCLRLATTAAGAGPGARGVREFQWLSSICGHRCAGLAARRLERIRRGVGSETMSQSFSVSSG